MIEILTNGDRKEHKRDQLFEVLGGASGLIPEIYLFLCPSLLKVTAGCQRVFRKKNSPGKEYFLRILPGK